MKCEVQPIKKLGDSPSSNRLPLRAMRLCGETQEPEKKLALISLLNAMFWHFVSSINVG